MIGEVVVIGVLKLRDDASLEEYERLGERMYAIVSKLRDSCPSSRSRLPMVKK